MALERVFEESKAGQATSTGIMTHYVIHKAGRGGGVRSCRERNRNCTHTHNSEAAAAVVRKCESPYPHVLRRFLLASENEKGKERTPKIMESSLVSHS